MMKLLVIAAALLGLAPTALAAAEVTPSPEDVSVSAKAFAEFLKSPNTHQHIPNNTFAGFRYGAYNFHQDTDLVKAAFPDFRIVDMKKSGAKGDGTTDDTKAIVDALDQAGPGTVLYFPAGDYVISDIIRVTKGNLVFMGDGPEKTTFSFQKSLTDLLGAFLKPSGPYYNRWSNHGGLIWVAPGNIWGKKGEYLYKKPDGLDVGWMNGVTIGKVTRPAARGDDTLTVACTPGTTAAQLLDGLSIMTWKNDPQNELLVHICGSDLFKKFDWSKTPKVKRDWEWLCEVKTATSRGDDTWELTLKQPLRIDIREQWAVEIRKPEVQGGAERYIENVALQGITLKMKAHEKWKHFHEPGFSGLFFQRSFNCFVHDVDLFNCDNGIVLDSSKCITIKKTRLLGDEKRHHGYYFRYNVHDCIVTGFQIGNCGNEGLSISHRSSGNVFNDGIMEHGSFDSHRGIPFDLIRTNITLVRNDGHQGGNPDAGPHNGARVVHWNITNKSRRDDTLAEPDNHPSGMLAGIIGAKYRMVEEGDILKGPKNTLLAPLNQEAAPKDLYRGMMEALKKP